MSSTLDRRTFLAGTAATAGALAFGPGFWREALAAPARKGPGPYGPLGPPDPATGLALPSGFTSREIARGDAVVPGTAYSWHRASDGAGCFAQPDGGWILVSNSEVGGGPNGGASSITFDRDGAIVGARRVLGGTTLNCSGGVTPWGTWLSGEEVDRGQVWECDPAGAGPAVARPAMGRFVHEAISTDPVGKRHYLTEDTADGCFYRFTPTTWTDLSAGVLEAMVVADDGKVTWAEVPDPSAAVTPTRQQVAAATRFQRGEGTWYDTGVIYFVTTTRSRLYALHLTEQVLEIVYDGQALGVQAELTGIDNVTVHPLSGDVFVAEDENADASLDVGIVSPEREVARFLSASGPSHAGSELTGPAFDPSGTRMYLASQRSNGTGAVYEITGPFRRERPVVPAGVPPTSLNGPAATTTPPPPPADVRRPRAVLLRVMGTGSLRAFRRGGLRLRVRVDEPARVDVVIRTALRGGRRGTRLASATGRAAQAGELRLSLRASRKLAAQLRRRRSLSVRIEVRARDGAGNVTTVVRNVRLR